jgi:aspartyl protease family protein
MKRWFLAMAVITALIGLLIYRFPYVIENSSQRAHLIYLGLLVIFITGSYFASGRHEGQMRNMLIWAALFVILIFGYEQRDVLQHSLMPHSVQQQADGNLMLSASMDGHFYIEAEVNGISVRFMLDTGASHIVLDPGDAKRIGFDLTQLIYNQPYSTANGMVRGASVVLDSITLGGVRYEDVGASVNSAKMGVSLLGMSFLRNRFDVTISGDRLTLSPRYMR